MRLLFLILLLTLDILSGGQASEVTKRHLSLKLRLKRSKKLDKNTPKHLAHAWKSTITQRESQQIQKSSKNHIGTKSRSQTNAEKVSKRWRTDTNGTFPSNKRQEVAAITGEPDQQRLFHVDETGTLHRHEVGPEEFSTPEGKTATFANGKSISSSNLRPSQAGPTEASTRQMLRHSGLYEMPPPIIKPGYHAVAFSAPPYPYPRGDPFLVPYPRPMAARLPRIGYTIPVPKIRNVPYPVAVPIQQPPIVKHIPVPVPYAVPSPPQIKRVPYPVPVPQRAIPEIRIQRIPVPIPVPQMIAPMDYPQMGPMDYPQMGPMDYPQMGPMAYPPMHHMFHRPISKGSIFRRPMIPIPVGLSECSTNPCRNRGTCYPVENTYKCHCGTGFKGRHCEDTSKCHPNPCENVGECTVLSDGYECSCHKGFRGPRCELKDQCHPSPCRNGGSCTSVINNYACSCIYGFIGKDCEVESKCFPLNPCKHGGTCHEDDAYYKCTCMSGWDGISCEIPDPCARSPCHHEGRCTSLGNTYTCACATGYLGKTCEIESQCHSSAPCQNGGTCREHGLEGYKCYCNSKWNGGNCEIPSDYSFSS